MSDESGGWLSDAVQSGAERLERATRSFLGIEREVFTCPDCGVACRPTHVYDPKRAAFDSGESPAWHCDDCDTNYVRETADDVHSMDLYER